MTGKESKAQYDAAAQEFLTANTEATRLAARIDDLAARLLQARLESSKLDNELKNFAVGNDSADTLAKKAASLARDIGTRRSECDAIVDVLEQALAKVNDELRAAKVRVVRAEAKAIEAQKTYYAALVRETADKFIKDNRAALLRLLQVTHAEGLVSRWRPYVDYPHGFDGVRSLDALFETVLAECAERWSSEDPAFDDVLGTIDKGDVPIAPLRAAIVTSAERGRISADAAAGRTSDEYLLGAVSKDDTPPPREPMDATSRSTAINAEREHRESAASARQSIAFCETELANAKTAAEKAAAEERLSRYRAAAERADQIAASWRLALEADDALR